MTFNQYSLDLEASSSQYAYVADNAALSITGDISIEAWIRVESLPGSNMNICGKYELNNQRAYQLYVGAANTLILQWNSNGQAGTNTIWTSSAAFFTTADLGKWVHVAVSLDVSAKTAVLYRNGSSVSGSLTTDGGATAISDTTAPFHIGARPSSGTYGEFLDGMVSNVRVWSDIRSGAEILAGMYTTYTGTDNNLVGSWYATANNHNDLAGTNNLTAVNTPVFSTNVPFTGANSTDWTVNAQIKADNTKVSGASDLTNFPVLIKDGNIPDSVYGGLKTAELNNGQISTTGLVGYWRLESSSADSIGSNTGTDTNMAYGSSYGKFGNGALFNSTPNSFFTKASPTGLPSGNTDLTVNVWANPRVAQSASVPALISFGAEANNQMAGFGLNNTGFYWLGYSNDASQAYSYATGSWTMFTATYVASSKTVKFYANGVQIGAGTVLTNTPNVGTTFLNFSKQRPGNAVYFDGQMDDASIWSRTLSAEEVLKLYQGVGDLRITTDSAGTTEIPFEIVSMDTTAKTAEVWAKIPTLTTATDTSIWLWSGNASAIAYDANAPFGSQAVWSAYGGVWHLQEASGTRADSSANANTLTDNNTVLSGTGKIGAGADFEASTTEFLSKTSPTGLSMGAGNFTVGGWINVESDTGTGDYAIVIKGAGGASQKRYYMHVDLNMKVALDIDDDGAGGLKTIVGATTLSTGTLYKVTGVRDGNNLRIYLNASSDQTATDITGYGNIDDTDAFTLGASNGSGTVGVASWFDGIIDEFRVIAVAQSSDWIATEYANQNDPSTFWSAVSSGGYTLALMGVGR